MKMETTNKITSKALQLMQSIGFKKVQVVADIHDRALVCDVSGIDSYVLVLYFNDDPEYDRGETDYSVAVYKQNRGQKMNWQINLSEFYKCSYQKRLTKKAIDILNK